jgi:hypothetical protein
VVRAEGRDTRYQTPEYIRFEGGVTTIRRTHSGVPKEHYRPWVVDENLYVTPAHTGTDGKGVAKLVGLAAFPINAKVTITNLEMERRHDLGHTVKARLKQRTGSLQALLPAPAAGASYRMVVSFPSDHLGAGSRSVELTHQFSLPVPTSGEARAGKLVYRRVGLDEGKHHISHGMYLEGWPTNPPSGGPW